MTPRTGKSVREVDYESNKTILREKHNFLHEFKKKSEKSIVLIGSIKIRNLG